MSDDALTPTATLEEAPAVGTGTYEAKNIEVLKNAAHIRKNPTMYIGESHLAGMHHLFYEVVHNSIDEAMAGWARHIKVKINLDGSLTVDDDGRGIPVEMHPTEKRPTLEVVMCEVGAGGKFNKDSYKISGGLHGMGVKAVNALSEWTEVEVRRDGQVYKQDYEKGTPVTEVQHLGKSTRAGSGTKVTFKPDPEFFAGCEFSFETIQSRLRELAFLNKGLAISLADDRSGQEETFKYAGGLAEYVEWMNRDAEPLHKPIVCEGERDGIQAEAVFQYVAGEEERVRPYSNTIYNRDGGTHLSGFRAALTRTIGAYGAKEGLIKETLTPIGEDFREGLTAVLNLRVPNAHYNNQAKEKLLTTEVEGVVSSIVSEQLARYLEENPAVAKKIVGKIVLAAEAREAAAKAKKSLKDRKNILSGGGLPGKLMDCSSRERDECELFLVEGDSAGGSADGGRERLFQAVLPLRGKILNVEKARLEKMLDNNEICAIISALGTDIGEAENLERLRYGKLILLTDADVDGSHIRTLLLTFLYRQMPKLVTEGHVFMAQPPLFKVTKGKQIRYVQTKEAMEAELFSRGLAGAKVTATAAEDGKPLWAVEGDRLRALVEVLQTLEDKLLLLERRGLNLKLLLDEARGGPLPQYRVKLDGADHWFPNAQAMEAFLQAEAQKRGGEVAVADDTARNGKRAAAAEVQDFHEVKAIARGLDRLKEFGRTAADLLPPKGLGGLEPLPKFYLLSGDSKRALADLRGLPAAVRQQGEKGLTITRFKGLGEMNPEELWDTTLDPARRTLLKVTLESLIEADEMFRTLMGDKVEPRRAFIEQYAREVRDLDV